MTGFVFESVENITERRYIEYRVVVTFLALCLFRAASGKFDFARDLRSSAMSKVSRAAKSKAMGKCYIISR